MELPQFIADAGRQADVNLFGNPKLNVELLRLPFHIV
jgi:hypothetical protein